jgi:hypothetical protein
MRLNAPPISEHRLQRYQRWMLLWLKWFATFLTQARAFAPFSDQAAAISHQWLDRIQHVLISIVILRTAPHVRVTNTPKHSARRRTETQLLRAIVGSAMRRDLRSKDLQQRIAALSQDVDVLVTRLIKRLPRGLTRRRPHRTRPEARPIARAISYAEAALVADTS